MNPLLTTLTSETLIADLRVCGVWEPQVDAIFDVHVVDNDAPLYCSCSPQAVIQSAEVEKKRKYLLACQDFQPDTLKRNLLHCQVNHRH